MKYGNLFQFIGSYYHQDWIQEVGNADADLPVRLYLKNSTTDSIRQVERELKDLLSKDKSEDALAKLMNEFGCCYLPSTDGLTYESWLQHLQKLMFAEITYRESTDT